jgi:hypothetical protein
MARSRLLRILGIVALVIVAAAAGFLVPRFLQYPSRIDFSYKFPDQIIDPKPIAPNVTYGCNAMTQAEVYENREDGPTANVASGRWGDVVSLKISSDGKGIVVSFPFAVVSDTSEIADPIPIVSRSGNYVLASKMNGTDTFTILFDTGTLKAIYSYAGQGMTGIKGRSLLLACR